MVISSRTPEGEPLKCEVCGHEHLVLSSWPPGDSVCPTCGSHSWLAAKKPEATFPSTEVLQRVTELVDKVRLSQSRSEMATHLVEGLFECLSPHGVMLWLPNPNAANDRMPYALVASKGEIQSDKTAAAVAKQRDDVIQIATTSYGKRLLIGVPLEIRDEVSVAGILEVSQRPETPPDARDAFLRFVRTMAAVASGSRVFTNSH